MSSCSICIEKYTQQTRKKIACNKCNFESCISCVKSYFKTSKTYPSCMSCNENFSEEFLYENFPKSYINKDLKELQQNLLFEAEKQLFPQAQNTAKYASHIKGLKVSIKEDDKKVKELQLQLKQLKVSLAQRKVKVSNFERSYNVPIINGDSSFNSKDDKCVFVKQCPSANCKGYLSTHWKCGMCEINVCNECLEIKDDNHICNPDNVLSAKIIFESTKPCPSCGTSIGKSDGCNHMWCINCKTAFDWKTQKLILKNNSNPHYKEWLKQNNNNTRELQDVTCGGNPTVPELYTVLRHYETIYQKRLTYYHHQKIPMLDAIHGNLNLKISMKISNETYFTNSEKEMHTIVKHICMFHRLVENINDRSELRDTVEEINNIDLRCKYLNEEITIEKYKQELLKREKKQQEKKKNQMIFLTLRDAGIDILQRFVMNEVKTLKTITTTQLEIENLIDFTNKSFEDLNNKFGIATHHIKAEFDDYVVVDTKNNVATK